MDDFIAELEKNISKLGSEIVWKRTIGDVDIWFSPISLYAQEKISEMMNNGDSMGLNLLHETKHLTLSYAISGINNIDLRPYRDVAPCFPVIGKDGRQTKVTLDKYIYSKIINWGAQFVDDAFSVYTDLIESHQKLNLAKIKFENAKPEEDELEELESRVKELRESLGKPQLVESTQKEEKPPVNTETKPVAQTHERPVLSVDFDPFAKIEARLSAPGPTSSPKVMEVAEDDGNLFVNAPTSTDPSIIDRRMTRPTGNPVVDQAANRNPKFSPPQR